MKYEEVYEYLYDKEDYFPAGKMSELTGLLLVCDPDAFEEIKNMRMKSPKKMQLVSVFFGFFGVDRFIMKNYIWACIKLLTQGGAVIGWLWDIFHIKEDVRLENYAKIKSKILPDMDTIIRHTTAK